MDIRALQGSSNYLKAADLRGRHILVVIRDVIEETIGQGKDAEQKAVLRFVDKEKGLVLNTVNGNSISDCLGFETLQWANKQIELYPTITSFGGQMVPCIRVSVPPTTPVAPLAGTPVSQPTLAPAPADPLGVPAAQTQRAMKETAASDDIPF